MRSFLLPVSALSFSAVLAADAAPPAWWAEGGVPALAPSAPLNNLGPANNAQAKWMAFRALGKLQTIDPVLAAAIHSKLTQPQPKPGGGTFPPTLDFNTPQPLPAGWADLQRAPLLVGQLKAISAPFYDLLQAKDPTWLSSQLNLNLTKDAADSANYYPWSSSTTDDANLSPATVGQLKSVFSLRFETLGGVPTGGSLDTDSDGLNNLSEYNAGTNSWASDTDGDGLPDKWEFDNSLSPIKGTGTEGSAGDHDGDGYTNMQEYLLHSDPDDGTSIPIATIRAGENHSLALTSDGRVWSWGSNGGGELGDGTQTNRNSPVPLVISAGMGKVIQIDAGDYFSMALDESGTLWAWGYNGDRQISKDPNAQYLTPFKVALPGPVARFACGGSHVLVVDQSGALWSWGNNENGQLGLGHTNPTIGISQITKPLGMGNITSLAASANSSYALDSTGKVWSWGYNDGGQLGNGSNMSQLQPVAVDVTTGISPIRSISAGESHVVASAVDGSIWTWGYNGYGQLGTGNITDANSPVKLVAGLTLASDLSTGNYHSLAVSPAGTVWAWGNNDYGQLGTSSTASANSPVQTTAVPAWSDIFKVTAGSYHSAAMKSDGSLWTWGYNDYGQLGLGDTTQRTIATQLTTLKLANDDSDADGMPDSWEKFHFGNLSQTATGVFLANGVTNLTAYTRGLIPTVLDNDADGIRDAEEIASNLDPLDWSDASGDLDGDRIPNSWEWAMGTSMTDPASKPAVTATVGAGQSIQTAINAVAGNASNPTRAIIQVQPGIYQENITLHYHKRIVLIPASGGGIPEIRGANGNATVSIAGESVVDGFRITHSPEVSGYGVYSYPQPQMPPARLVNCMVHDNSGYSGNGINSNYGRTVIAHCTVFRNSVSEKGNGLYVNGVAKALLINSIFWNPNGEAAEEIYSDGVAAIKQSVVRDNSIAGALITNPIINSFGFLASISPVRAQASLSALAFRDIHGETRGSLPDIGADQFVDADTDGLPDWLESQGITSATGDNDGDGVSNLYEYVVGLNPFNTDTLSNGRGDYVEAGYMFSESGYPSEWKLDPDHDGLPTGLEIAYGFDPSNPDSSGTGIPDGMIYSLGLRISDTDWDDDGVTNLLEVAIGTSPLVADSDGDGVLDGADAFPLDPSRWNAPGGSAGDETGPIITLIEPVGAVPVP